MVTKEGRDGPEGAEPGGADAPRADASRDPAPVSEAVRLERLDDSLRKVRELLELRGDFDFSKVRLPDVSGWEDELE